MNHFVHLRARTEYCISQSSLRVDEYVQSAHEDGQGALAATDIDTMFGAIRFYDAARKGGIKPIMGLDVSVLINAPDPELARLLFLAKSKEGYCRLMQIATKIQVLGSQGKVPALTLPELFEGSNSELFCLAGAHEGLGRFFSSTALAPFAEQAAKALSDHFHGSFFLEVQRRGAPEDQSILDATIAASDRLCLPICATHPLQFLKKEDFLAHEARVCDQRGQIIHDRRRSRDFTPHQHFTTSAQMGELFRDLPEALANSVAIATCCNVTLDLGKSVLPDYPTEGNASISEALQLLSATGLSRRLGKLFPDPLARANTEPQYRDRLRMELDVIHGMGFDGYFMIVQDFINWAKSKDIPVGPGRGSGAGSLVAYALGITDLDPLAYNLLFERFLNPERVSMPDFDIDFCKAKREQVIHYVTNKYGSEAVSGIANINTLQARAAIKAAGRALGMRVPFVDGVSRLIPVAPGKEVSIASALKEEPLLSARLLQEPEVERLLLMAKALEGLPTAIGQHAAGLVISPTLISDYSPLYLPEGKTQSITQFDKDDIEKAGLVKFDFLGLKTLTQIKLAVDIINERTGSQSKFDIDSIALDDPLVLSVFQRGDTHCVFQFESLGMQRLLRDAHPESFGDLVALNALYRPGPMDLIPEFIKRKKGLQQVTYLDERLEPILAETYGIMVYQEQVMQIAQAIGGYTLGGADLLRRAMGKKKVEEMAKHRQIFIDGAHGKNVSAESAGILFDMMEKFAGYGFNKSHAAAYTLIAYQTAHLKHYHPEAFYASWLSIESEEDTAVLPGLLADAKKHGISVEPPCINSSISRFTLNAEGNALLYSLAALKGLGIECARAIVDNRRMQGSFESLGIFATRLCGSVNKRALSVLLKAGAFDAMIPSRKNALANLDLVMKFAKSKKSEAKPDDTPPKKRSTKKAPLAEPTLGDASDEVDHLELSNYEREAFGFYFSHHPYVYYAAQLDGLKACESLEEVARKPTDWEQHIIAGVVLDCRVIDTKSGKFLIATVSDGKCEIEVKAFSTVANKIMDWFKKDAFVLMAVNLREDRLRGGKSIQLTDAKPFNEAKALLMEAANIMLSPADMPKLQDTVAKNPGPLPLFVWHPSGPLLACSKSPYAYVSQTAEFIDKLSQNYQDDFAIEFMKGKPLMGSGRS